MIFEILVGRNTPSIGANFAEIIGPLCQIWPENLVFLILDQK